MLNPLKQPNSRNGPVTPWACSVIRWTAIANTSSAEFWMPDRSLSSNAAASFSRGKYVSTNWARTQSCATRAR